MNRNLGHLFIHGEDDAGLPKVGMKIKASKQGMGGRGIHLSLF